MSSDINQNILNFLRRRHEISKIEIAGTEVIQLYFNNGEVIINSLQNRKQMELKILYYLEDNGYIDMNTFFSNERSPEMVSVIRTVRKFLNEVMPQSIKESFEEDEEQSKGPYVIFVSGIESAMSHKGQTSLFEQSYSGNYPVKSFNFKNKSSIQSFIDNNSVKAIVLFSAACKLANQLNFPSNKIYCIEPWNGVDRDDGRGDSIYTNIPAQNMYIDYKSYSRGKGTKKGANETDHAAGHFKALTNSVSKIRF